MSINFTIEANEFQFDYLDILIFKEYCEIITDLFRKKKKYKYLSISEYYMLSSLSYKTEHPIHYDTTYLYNCKRWVCWLVGFYGMPTIEGYLMLNPALSLSLSIYIYIIYIYGWDKIMKTPGNYKQIYFNMVFWLQPSCEIRLCATPFFHFLKKLGPWDGH